MKTDFAASTARRVARKTRKLPAIVIIRLADRTTTKPAFCKQLQRCYPVFNAVFDWAALPSVH